MSGLRKNHGLKRNHGTRSKNLAGVKNLKEDIALMKTDQIIIGLKRAGLQITETANPAPSVKRVIKLNTPNNIRAENHGQMRRLKTRIIIQETSLKAGVFPKINPSQKTALMLQRNHINAMANAIKIDGLIPDRVKARINLNASFYQNYRSPKG